MRSFILLHLLFLFFPLFLAFLLLGFAAVPNLFVDFEGLPFAAEHLVAHRLDRLEERVNEPVEVADCF